MTAMSAVTETDRYIELKGEIYSLKGELAATEDRIIKHMDERFDAVNATIGLIIENTAKLFESITLSYDRVVAIEDRLNTLSEQFLDALGQRSFDHRS